MNMKHDVCLMIFWGYTTQSIEDYSITKHMERSTISSWENSLFLWAFSIAMLVYYNNLLGESRSFQTAYVRMGPPSCVNVAL